MNAARRTSTALIAVLLFTLAAAGCGVKEKDGASGTATGTTETTAAPDTTEPSEDTTETTEGTTEDTTDSSDPTDTSVPDFGDFGKDELVKIYTDMGLSEKQASCLVDAIFDSTTNGSIDPNDTSAIFDFLATCEIDITDFGGTGSGN